VSTRERERDPQLFAESPDLTLPQTRRLPSAAKVVKVPDDPPRPWRTQSREARRASAELDALLASPGSSVTEVLARDWDGNRYWISLDELAEALHRRGAA
jgi:hypothetical protein